MTYDPKSFTWGFEMEVGDADRRLPLPEHLGKWEFSETDVVNLNPPYRGIACDPLGIEPPFGGEINVRPTKTWKEQVDRIFEILDFYRSNGNNPTSNCISHNHIHVFVPGLKEDVDALKRLIAYIRDNQHVVVDRVHAFRLHPDMSSTKTAKSYLKLDCGRLMPDYMSANIINLTTDFEHFIKLHAAGKDGKSMGRPFRYAINTYCMKHTGTIEFRCFRNSLDRRELEDSFKFVEKFMDAALNDGPDVQQILLEGDYKFPELKYDHEIYTSWEKTKYGKERGKKAREFIEV
jgi:hypothetical protein